METDTPGKIRLKESRERRREFYERAVHLNRCDEHVIWVVRLDQRKTISFNGRTKKIYRYLNNLLIYRRGKGGTGLILFTNYCAGICRKYFLFYFPMTHSIFLSAIAALEIGSTHLYKNTSNLPERFKCDFLLR